MKIYITDRGDTSVGIPDGLITIDWPSLDFEGMARERSDFRYALKEFFNEWSYGNRVLVQFEDECPDCGHALSSGVSGPNLSFCSNKNCITHQPRERNR